MKLFGVGTLLVLAAALVSAQSHPSHQMTNGEISATVYLPDAKSGFLHHDAIRLVGSNRESQVQGPRLLRDLVLEDHRHLRLRIRRAQQGRHLCEFHGDGRS